MNSPLFSQQKKLGRLEFLNDAQACDERRMNSDGMLTENYILAFYKTSLCFRIQNLEMEFGKGVLSMKPTVPNLALISSNIVEIPPMVIELMRLYVLQKTAAPLYWNSLVGNIQI